MTVIMSTERRRFGSREHLKSSISNSIPTPTCLYNAIVVTSTRGCESMGAKNMRELTNKRVSSYLTCTIHSSRDICMCHSIAIADQRNYCVSASTWSPEALVPICKSLDSLHRGGRVVYVVLVSHIELLKFSSDSSRCLLRGASNVLSWRQRTGYLAQCAQLVIDRFQLYSITYITRDSV